jgi:hypothetical protein
MHLLTARKPARGLPQAGFLCCTESRSEESSSDIAGEFGEGLVGEREGDLRPPGCVP